MSRGKPQKTGEFVKKEENLQLCRRQIKSILFRTTILEKKIFGTHCQSRPMIFGLLALLMILFTSPLHAAEEALFVRDANLLKAKSLRCLFTRQVTTNWTSWETTWSKEATIENMEYIFAAIPQKGSKARLIKRVPGEPSGIQEVFIIRTLEALNFLEVNPERPIHTTAVMVMRENREAGTFVATTSQHTITRDGAVVPTQSYGRCEVMAFNEEQK